MTFCAYGRQLGKGNCVHPFKWYALALYFPGSNKTCFDPVTSTQKQAHFTGLWMQLKLSQEGKPVGWNRKAPNLPIRELLQ